MKQYQSELLINNICRELNIVGSEKTFAFDFFIQRISESLKYDEAIRIPKLGIFQLKKGINEQNSNSDILVFVPFNIQNETENFAFFNIPVKKKENDLNKSIDEIFSLSVNKPIISIKGINDSDNSLFIIQKRLEEQINYIIQNSDFLEGLNLWEDFVLSNGVSFEDDTTVINQDENNSEHDLLPRLEFSFADEKGLNIEKDNNIKENDLLINYVNADEELSNADLFLDENLFNENEDKYGVTDLSNNDEIEKTILDNPTVTDNEINDSINAPEISDEIDNDPELSLTDQLNIIDELTITEEHLDNDENIKDDNREIADGLFEDESEIEDIKLSYNEASKIDTDWTKELEDELFSDNLNEEQVDISELKENFDLPIDENEISEDISSLSDKLNFGDEDKNTEINEFEETSDTISNSFNNSEDDESKNIDYSVEEEAKHETNIDDLFDSLVEKKEEIKTLTPQKNKKKLLIYILGSGLIIFLLLLGYYFMFYKSTDSKKVSKVEEHSVTKNEENKDAKSESDKHNGNELISKEDKIEIKEENSKNKQEESKPIEPKPLEEKQKETLVNKESIINNKQNKEEIIKPISGELYKTGIDDKQIAEKIFFDGKKYNVQTSSWNSKTQAESAAKRLRSKGINAFIVKVDLRSLGVWYRIKVFGFDSKSEAEDYINKNKL